MRTYRAFNGKGLSKGFTPGDLFLMGTSIHWQEPPPISPIDLSSKRKRADQQGYFVRAALVRFEILTPRSAKKTKPDLPVLR